MKQNLCIQGKKQSPINIISQNSKKCGATCDLSFFYKNSKLNIKTFGKDIILEYDTGSYINFNQEIYELDKITFTNPSSHTIDNTSYSAEIHLYHRSPYSGKGLIIGIMLEINEASSKSKQFLDSIIDSIPKNKGELISVNTNDKWNIHSIIPEIQGFYLYDGSILKPPCTENITWIIYDEPVNCSQKFYDSINKICNNNARPLKSIDKRIIYYNPNTYDKNLRNHGSKVKCYTNKELMKEFEKFEANKSFKKKGYVYNENLKVFFITLFFCIFILLILLILYLKDIGYIDKILSIIANYLKDYITEQ